MEQTATRPAFTPTDRRSSRSARRSTSAEVGLDSRWIALVLAHVPLAALMKSFPVIGAVHALAAVAIGVALAIQGRHWLRTASVVAYIAGSEVLWRMGDAPIFWETGKYAACLIMLPAILRTKSSRIPWLVVAYLALLIPSAYLTVTNEDATDIRGLLSMNLSGPISLALSAVFFSRLKFTTGQMQRILLTVTGPAIGMITLIVLKLAGAVQLKFTDESNFGTSGGFGPNQVSAALSLAAVAAIVYIMITKGQIVWKIAAGLLAALFLSFSALTFSRGGLYLATGTLALVSLTAFRDSKTRINLILIFSFATLAASQLIVPQLNTLTDNQLSARFSDISSTGRDTIVLADLRIFAEHPVAGVGPGLATVLRDTRGMAHTEYTRLLAEHGALGLLAMVFLVVACFKSRLKCSSVRARAVITSAQVWAAGYMAINAMRTFAPSFLIGLSFATIVSDEPLAGDGKAT